MEYAAGAIGAVCVGLFATWVGLDRERSFYPVVLIVIATYYLLFAVNSAQPSALLAESIPAATFIAAAAIGFRKSLWIVVAGLALHGVFDFFHPAAITNPGVPPWWPGWCLAYDVSAALYLSALIRTRAIAVRPDARSRR